MVYAAVFWLNTFPLENGVSTTLSPCSLLTGQVIDYHRHCRLKFGAYAQVHESHDNSMAPQTVGALALCPTGNAQGRYFFFSLSTGRVVNRAQWTELPMPPKVVEWVHDMASASHAPAGVGL